MYELCSPFSIHSCERVNHDTKDNFNSLRITQREHMMNRRQLKAQQQEATIAALGECYRRLKEAGISAKDLTQDGFQLMFKSAYKNVSL